MATALTSARLGEYLEAEGIDWREEITWKEKAAIAERLSVSVQSAHAALCRLREQKAAGAETNGHHPEEKVAVEVPKLVFRDQEPVVPHVDYRDETLWRLAQGIASVVLQVGAKNIEPEELRGPIYDMALHALSLRPGK